MRILAALVVLASSSLGAEQALTAGNAVDATRAGGGVTAISGYVVDEVSYELDGAAIASVSFRLTPATARTVRVRLRPAGAWHPCALAGSGGRLPHYGGAGRGGGDARGRRRGLNGVRPHFERQNGLGKPFRSSIRGQTPLTRA